MIDTPRLGPSGALPDRSSSSVYAKGPRWFQILASGGMTILADVAAVARLCDTQVNGDFLSTALAAALSSGRTMMRWKSSASASSPGKRQLRPLLDLALSNPARPAADVSTELGIYSARHYAHLGPDSKKA
jgi:hypothetical protein